MQNHGDGSLFHIFDATQGVFLHGNSSFFRQRSAFRITLSNSRTIDVSSPPEAVAISVRIAALRRKASRPHSAISHVSIGLPTIPDGRIHRSTERILACAIAPPAGLLTKTNRLHIFRVLIE